MRIDTNYGQVVDTIENYYAGPPVPPPEDHPNSRVCPQCQQTTWRLTQHCLRCGFDLFAMDARDRRRRLIVRQMKFAAFFALLAGLAMYSQRYVPDWARLWVMGVGIVSMIFAAGIMRD